MRFGLYAFAFALLPLSGQQQPKYAAFWTWFDAHSARLYAMRSPTDPILDSLGVALAKVHRDLTFEIGPEAPRRELIISADGIRSAFAEVEALVAAAPRLAKWQVIKFRPRRTSLNLLTIDDVTFDPSRVRFVIAKDDPGKVALLLFFDQYTAARRDLYQKAGFLLLDEALGEYDTEMKVGSIDFVGFDSKYFPQSRPLTELASAFDAYLGPRR